MVRVERFVDGLKAEGAEFFAGVPVKVKVPCGCDCTGQGICPNDYINELYQKLLTL